MKSAICALFLTCVGLMAPLDGHAQTRVFSSSYSSQIADHPFSSQQNGRGQNSGDKNPHRPFSAPQNERGQDSENKNPYRSSSSQQNKRLKLVIDQSEARVRLIDTSGRTKEVLASEPAGVAKHREWRVKPGTYKVTLLAEKYIFTDWGTPRPRAGCGIRLERTDGASPIPAHPKRRVLIHTEPSPGPHPAHNTCRRKGGEFTMPIADVRAVDDFKGRGYRSHGCVRVEAEFARYLYKTVLNHHQELTVIIQ